MSDCLFGKTRVEGTEVWIWGTEMWGRLDRLRRFLHKDARYSAVIRLRRM